MSSIMKVVFPTPPPTTNDLSSHQRSQLLRKAKKLEQIFGATPHLVEDTLEPTDPIHITFSRRPSQRRVTKTCRESIDSDSSTSSCNSLLSPGKRALAVSCNSQSIRSVKSRQVPTRSVSSVSSSGSWSWPRKAKGPVLRLIMNVPTLESIPSNSSPNSMSKSPLQLPISHTSDVLFSQFIASEDPSTGNPVSNPPNITPPNSLRRQKMDRLRRKLGQDVPFDLVFPSDTDTDLSTDVSRLPTPGRPSGRISTARDSIARSTSVHRARRQSQPSSISSPILSSTSSLPKSMQISPSLSFIIESPDEHGIGCAEEFGQSRKLGHSTGFKSEWTVSTGGAEVKLWSTRRGYEGWSPKSPPSKTSQIPPTMSLPSPPPPSNTKAKKKSPSYRKPAPPISDDCY